VRIFGYLKRNLLGGTVTWM